MSGRLVGPKTWDLNAGNLGLFWAVSGQIYGLLWVHMRCLCVNCGFRCCGARNGHGFWFQRSGTEVEEGLSTDSPHTVFRIVKICLK